MVNDGLIVTIKLEVRKELKEMFPTISFVELEHFEQINIFKTKEIMMMIIDIDRSGIDANQIKLIKDAFKISPLITSRSYANLSEEYWGAETCLKNVSLLSEVILENYEQRIRSKSEKYLFNYKNSTVTLGNTTFYLRRTPFKILAHLVENRNQVCSREEILLAIGGNGSLSDTRTIDVHINYLRKVLTDLPIKTVVGEGYIFEE